MAKEITRSEAVALLQNLVAIPSLSREEARAVSLLVARMDALGFARVYVDAAGNAVGEIGAPDAPVTLLLLGHIDTVAGAIPVRIEQSEAGELLYGSGSVDAKGPLAAFVVGAALAGDDWARAAGVRVVVVGAVEEEAATSKGARFIRDRFDGRNEAVPAACLIGEPSGAGRVTVGYKGRLLIELEAAQPMAHTAGPDAGVAVAAVSLWNRLAGFASDFNSGRDRAFEQVQPSLRSLRTWTDEQLNDRVEAHAALRLPPAFDVASLARLLGQWAASEAGAQAPPDFAPPPPNEAITLRLEGEHRSLRLTLRAYEPAWRSDRNGAIVRALLSAIRAEQPTARPGYLVKTGTSDMNVVGPAWQCPIAAYGPGESALDHTPNEHISLDEYWVACQTVARCLRDFTSFL